MNEILFEKTMKTNKNQIQIYKMRITFQSQDNLPLPLQNIIFTHLN